MAATHRALCYRNPDFKSNTKNVRRHKFFVSCHECLWHSTSRHEFASEGIQWSCLVLNLCFSTENCFGAFLNCRLYSSIILSCYHPIYVRILFWNAFAPNKEDTFSSQTKEVQVWIETCGIIKLTSVQRGDFEKLYSFGNLYYYH